MKTPRFFEQLLNLSAPFSVSKVEYQQDEESKLSTSSVHIYIDVDTSSTYHPLNSKIHDYEDRSWRHLNLFQYACYLHCRVPKYKDKKTQKVTTLPVPWAVLNSGFTLLFEEFALELVKLHGCVSEVARQYIHLPSTFVDFVDSTCLHYFGRRFRYA